MTSKILISSLLVLSCVAAANAESPLEKMRPVKSRELT